MRKYLFIVALSCCLQLRAQVDSKPSTIFNFGAPLNSSWVNISNLAFNTSNCNGAKVKILSFELIGEVKSMDQAIKLGVYNHKHMPQLAVRNVFHQDIDEKGNVLRVVSVLMEPIPDDEMKLIKREGLLSKDLAKETIKNNVRIGFEIYLLKYSIDSKKYKEYIFVDPNSNEVATACGFWSGSEEYLKKNADAVIEEKVYPLLNNEDLF